MALVGALCLAEQQIPRGRFRNVRVLKALLGDYGRHVKALVERGDVTVLPDGGLYVDGWDEWQEGDVTVKERMARIRRRKHRDAGDRNTRNGADSNPTLPPRLGSTSTPASGTESAAGLSPAPAKRGRRKDATNPRALGTNPRENGTNPRQIEHDRKHGPTRIGEILRRVAAES